MAADLSTTHLRSALPLILLASDEPRLAARLHYALCEQKFAVKLAAGYGELESLAVAHDNAIVLLEISRHQSVEDAVEVALRIKRNNASRFIGYLADRVLHSSGLAGDAIFRAPRTISLWPCGSIFGSRLRLL
jgi:hypothetical protein